MRDIGEHLLGLLLERCLVELAAVGCDRQLPRDEDEPAGADAMAVMAARRGHARGIDVHDLTSHRDVSMFARHRADPRELARRRPRRKRIPLGREKL
jgi:hypothetical protein